MKYTHRSQGPRKAVGNGFIPQPARQKPERHVRPLVANLPPEALPDTLEGVLKLVLHEVADGA